MTTDAPLTLWGRLNSINVRKVVWTLNALQLPFERIDAGRQFGIVGTADFLASNPNGLVPLLRHGDFDLWESNVIVRYLCARFGAGTWCPADLRTRFEAERWMDWQQTTLNRAGGDAFKQLIRTPAAERNDAAIATSVAAMQKPLALLDAHLSRHAFVAGDAISMGDIPVACDVHRWWHLPRERTGFDPQAFPHISRWWAVIDAHPASRSVFDAPLS